MNVKVLIDCSIGLAAAVAVGFMLARHSQDLPVAQSQGEAIQPVDPVNREVTGEPLALEEGSARKVGPEWGRSVEMGDPLYGAKNADDLEWLRRNGYPSMEQRQRVSERASSDVDLKSMPVGDPVGIMLAESILQRDPSNARAEEYLRQSSIRGSIYALEAIARTKPEVDGVPSIERVAYYKAAAMRGNWAVDVAGASYVRDERVAMLSSMMAQQIVSGIDKARGQLGMDPLVRDPKPGLIDFINATGQKK
ncbi:hypothetical protein [Stenotrophomonas lactitubi]|uniref:hypothetical protein n=1 Tax=Stenotrophomonas lactitubi TaxID=2045214 RepID=UPI001D25EB88|nr:hypothetical protein [Stenotrophomonas lactitubi]CAH0244193.1 hypothetical protein SRABI35_02783 [Stenotrophomonas lactitubi]